MVATAGMLTKPDVVAYVGANASRYNLDPAAVLAVANGEGLGTTPGSTWYADPSEPYKSFGPPSWYGGGAGAAIITAQGSPDAASRWSWTPAGLDYWLQSVSQSAAGLTGLTAIRAIVTGFERPAARYVQGNIDKAWSQYSSFQQQIQTGPGNPIVTTPPEPGTLVIPGQGGVPGQFPTPTNPQQPTQTKTSAKFSLPLFQLPTGPVNLTLPWDFSGILMFLAAIFAIIIGALLWKPSRGAITTTAAMAA
jgi:hypothetical protein